MNVHIFSLNFFKKDVCLCKNYCSVLLNSGKWNNAIAIFYIILAIISSFTSSNFTLFKYIVKLKYMLYSLDLQIKQ